MLVNVNYPEVVLNIKDVKAAIDAGDKVSDLVEKHLDELDNNINIMTSEESGIKRRENILGIKPPDTASLEDRRLEVLMRWYDTPLYTETTLRNKLDSVLGRGNYVLTIDLDKKLVECQIELTRRLMFKSVQELFEQMVPLDYLLSVVLRYNQHATLHKYTHAQLAAYTHFGLRNEVLSVAEEKTNAKAASPFSAETRESTPNFGLEKPLETEFYDVGVFNSNFDKIDTKMKELETGGGTSYEELTIPTDGWKVSGEYQTYKKTYAGAVMVNVNFSKESLPAAIEAGVLPVTETTGGACTIFATKIPKAQLKATVEIIRGAV